MDYGRNAFMMSFIRKYTIKIEGEDKEFSRVYDVSIPVGSNWEEIYGVLSEAIADIKRMEDETKKKAEDEKAKEEKKEDIAS